MGFEVDFLPVGTGQRGGDAIAIRFGDLHGKRENQCVMVIDGGTKESGATLVEHIKTYYKTEKVDIAIASHLHADHISGLGVVIDELEVSCLFMHKPWEHASQIKELFKSGRITATSLKENLKKSLNQVYDLVEVANKKKMQIREPFSDEEILDMSIGNIAATLQFLSPSKAFYQFLIPNFTSTPKPKEECSLVKTLLEAAKEGISWVLENWQMETLLDPTENETTAENNSSVVFLLTVEGKKMLFTGDAGAEALTEALKKTNYTLKDLSFFQVPHHGSKHNLGPTILDNLIGEKQAEEKNLKCAFISAPKDGDPKHPSRKVCNALKRRGARVVATQGDSKTHRSNAPDREGWVDATILPFYSEVAD